MDNVKSYDFTETETRSMLANFLFHDDEDLDFKKSSIAVICGIALAGAIMLTLSLLGLVALG